MRSILAVYKRELALFFRSPVAYAIAFALFMLLSVLFSAIVFQGNGRIPADAAFAPNLLTFLMFLIGPLLTMRLLAEENREGTLEVLMTLPMHERNFIIGKFLAAWTYYTLLLLLSVIYLILFSVIGVPDQGVAFGAYFGAWLYGGAVLAVSMIWSAVTEDQIVAAFLSAATVLVLFLADAAALIFESGSVAATIVRELGLNAHYNATLVRGVIRAEDIVYFAFMMIGALFITTRIVETRRWRA